MVVERVCGAETPKTGKVFVPLHLMAGGRDSPSQRIDVTDEDTWVRFAGWPELGLDAKMKFEVTGPKPGATTLGEN